MKMKTIWIINQECATPALGIAGRHHYFAQELGRRGYKVYLIIGSYHHLRNDSNSIQAVNPFYTLIEIPTFRYGGSKSFIRIINWEIFRLKISSLGHKIPDNPDVIYYSSLSLVGVLAAVKLKKMFGAKLCFEVRDIWPLSLVEVGKVSAKHVYVRYLQKIEDLAYREADWVISNLKNAQQHMLSRGMAQGKFSWIPNGISFENLKKIARTNKRTELKLKKNEMTIGYCGSLNNANSPFNLVEAARILRDDKRFKFVICGDGINRQKLRDLCTQYNLNNVDFWEKVSQNKVPDVLDKFDVCYLGLPKLCIFEYGVSPNKLFEYMSASKPIIYAVDSGTYRPVLDAKCGIEIAPDNPQELVSAAIKMYDLDRVDLGEIGRNGFRYVEKNHVYENLCDNLISLWEDKH